MTFEVVYTSEASDDIDLAFDWFAARAPSAATDFLRAIGRTETHLQRNPAIYRVVRRTSHGEVRRANIRPYRYQLYFLVTASKWSLPAFTPADLPVDMLRSFEGGHEDTACLGEGHPNG